MTVKRYLVASFCSNLAWALVWAVAMRNERVRQFMAPMYELIAEKVVEQMKKEDG